MPDSDKPKHSFQDQKLYYDKHWRNKKPVIDQVCKAQFIIRYIERIRTQLGRSLRICDLGCGRGWLSAMLSKYGEVLGVDLSISMAQKSYPNLKFKQANIITDDIEGQYDVVVSCEVIEHLEPQFQPIYVTKCHGLLDANGFLIITTPNRPIAEAYVKASIITKEGLQPVETWLDKKSLSSLLQPHFKVEGFNTAMFYPPLFRKYRPLDITYFLLYEKLGLYKPLDRILNLLKAEGHYLVMVARRS